MTLRIVTGIDLVRLSRFREAWAAGNGALARRLFHPSEIAGAAPEQLAGAFAIKEAVAKALDLPPDSWLEIEVRRRPTGKPEVVLGPAASRGVVSVDVSLSHHDDLAVASCVALREVQE